MTTYDLYLESGPDHQETMVHVLSLPGCMLHGPTTAAAQKETPAVIRAWLRFLARHGEQVDPETPFETRVMAHDTSWDTSGYDFRLLTWPPEHSVIAESEIRKRLQQVRWLNEELASWGRGKAESELRAEPPDGGWSARQIVLHVIESQDGYSERILGEEFGFESTYNAIEAGELPLDEGLMASIDLIETKVLAAPPEVQERQIVDGDYVFTLNRALRRTAEHAWEHLLELSHRPGGPVL